MANLFGVKTITTTTLRNLIPVPVAMPTHFLATSKQENVSSVSDPTNALVGNSHR